MKKDTKIFFVVVSIICIICLIIGIKVRGSIKDIEYKDIITSAEEHGYNIITTISDTKDLELEKVKDELEDKSDSIITGKFTGNRKILNGSILSEVKVSHIYKGDENLTNIFIYEPIQYILFIDDNLKGNVISQDGYGLMNEEKEYLLFLKAESNAPGFGDLKKSDKAFTYSEDMFGKILIDDDENNYKVLKELNKQTGRYNEVIGYEQVFTNEEVFNFYKELKSIVVDKYATK